MLVLLNPPPKLPSLTLALAALRRGSYRVMWCFSVRWDKSKVFHQYIVPTPVELEQYSSVSQSHKSRSPPRIRVRDRVSYFCFLRY